MASLQHKPDGRAVIQFTLDDRRRTLRLGLVSHKVAARIKARVEQVVDEIHAGGKPSADSVAWMNGLGSRVRQRMTACGLFPRRETITVGQLCRRFDQQSDRKDSTDAFYRHTLDNLRGFFGGEMPAQDVTPARAAEFRQYLVTKYAVATVNRRIRAARTVFRLAVRQKLIEDNPFAQVKSGSQRNDARKRYVPADVIDRLIGVADPELAAALALARFAGLRFPSEVTGLRPEDVRTDRLIVRSPKTAHHEGKGERVVPIYWALRQRWWAIREHGCQWKPATGQAMSRRMLRQLEHIGVTPWPRLWQNLRASCETDLVQAGIPPHLVARWMGHSLMMSEQHYHIVTEEALQKATRPAGFSTVQQGPSVATGDISTATGSGYGGGAVGRKGRQPVPPEPQKITRAAHSDARKRARQRGLLRAYRRNVG